MDGFNIDPSCEMTNLHSNGTATENHQSVVTMAEVSSQEITSAEVPQQPQAVSCALEQQGLSTVYVQKPSSLPSLPSISSGVVSRPVAEHAPKIRLLTRTPAMRSMSSPPPSFQLDDPEITTLSIKNNISPRAQSLDSSDSSQSGHSGKLDDFLAPKNSISRDSSFDYTDSTGVDLEEFIIQTLKNPRDKKMLLRLESDFTNFINDPSRPILHYPPMTSYHRMIVHRVAAYFGMDHNVDMTGKSVVMNKTMNTRIPDFKFREFLSRENSEEDSTGNGPRTILKRESMEEGTPPKVESPKPSSVVHPLEEKRSKSFEEREEEYSKARARIFNQESMSSQSSQSSKDGGDLEPVQILQAARNGDSTDSENKELQPPSDEQAPFEFEESQTPDDSPSQKSDDNKEEDEPKTTVSQTTATEKPQQQQTYKSYGSSKGRQQSGSAPSLTSWAAEGAPLMPPTLDPGGLHMFPYPGLQGMVPVMPQHPAKPMSIPDYHTQPTGGVVWNVPVDAMQQPVRPHGPTYLTPQTGVQVVPPDGMGVYSPPYNMTAMKPTAHGPVAYMQHPQHQSAASSQSMQQPVPVQSPPHQQQQHQAQMMIPQQYYGMQQPVFYVPPQHRPQYPTQQPLDPNQRWPAPSQQPLPQVAQSPTSPSYPEMSHHFAGMSLVPRPSDVETQQQQRPSVDSTSQTTGSYGGTHPPVMQNQHPHIQYVFVSPQGQYRPGFPMIAQQMPQQGSNQQHPTYVYGQQIYQGQIPQYGLSTDPILQPRSQTPPTPPRTTSPIISSPQFPSHPVTQAGPNSHQMNRPQQTLTPPYQPRTPPHTPSGRPFLIQGPHGLSLPPTHVLPMGHASAGTHPQHIATSPSQIVFSQGQMFQPPQQMAQRKTLNDRRVGKADVFIPDNTAKSQSSPITSPSQAINPGMQYWTGHSVGSGYHPPTQFSVPRHDLNQQRFLHGQAIAHYQYQMQQFTKSKQRPYKQRQGPRQSSSDTIHNKKGGGGTNNHNSPALSNQDSEKSADTSSSITTSSGTGASHILEVYDYPEGIKNHQADLLFDELKKTGARIQWLSNSGPSSSPPQGGGSSVLLAIFSSSTQAQRALDTINSSSYKLRVPPHHTVLQKTSDGSLKNS